MGFVIDKTKALLVECGIPLDSQEPIVARLNNLVPQGKGMALCWMMECRRTKGAFAPDAKRFPATT